MKKIWKILVGIGAVIIGILAISSKGSKKQFKKDLKDNKKKLDTVKNKQKDLDKKEKAIQQFVVIKKLKNTGVKYDTFQSDVGSWDKYGDKDFSTDFDDSDFD